MDFRVCYLWNVARTDRQMSSFGFADNFGREIINRKPYDKKALNLFKGKIFPNLK